MSEAFLRSVYRLYPLRMTPASIRGKAAFTSGGNPAPDEHALARDLLSVSVLSSLLLFSVLLIKVYGAAHYNVDVVATLASTAPASVLLGTISIYSYFFLAMISVEAAWLLFASFFKAWSLKPYRTLFAGVAIFLFLLSPLRYFFEAAVLSIALVLFELIAYNLTRDQVASLLRLIAFGFRRGTHFFPRIGVPRPGVELRKGFPLPRASLISSAIIFALFLLLTLDQPWAPSVVVTLKHPISTNLTRPIASRSQKPVAFVLADDNGTMQLLIDDSRTIVYVPDKDVRSEQLCNLNSNFMGSNPAFKRSRDFQGNVESCWRITDQCDEQTVQGPTGVIGWLEQPGAAPQWPAGPVLPPVSTGKTTTGAGGRCGPPFDPNLPNTDLINRAKPLH